MNTNELISKYYLYKWAKRAGIPKGTAERAMDYSIDLMQNTDYDDDEREAMVFDKYGDIDLL